MKAVIVRIHHVHVPQGRAEVVLPLSFELLRISSARRGTPHGCLPTCAHARALLRRATGMRSAEACSSRAASHREESPLELQSLGWNSRFAAEFEQYAGATSCPRGSIAGQRELCTVIAAQGELLAEVSGRFRREAEEKSDFPVVGDWVAITPRPGDGRATIHGLLTAIERVRPQGGKRGRRVAHARAGTGRGGEHRHRPHRHGTRP